jgi:ankyrin repeat protein
MSVEFFEAIRAGDLAAVTNLLGANASLASAKNDAGVSAVLMSVYAGKQEIRDLLLARGASLELHDAAAVGNLRCAKQLVEKNPASARSFSPDGFPVVALAAVFGHLEVARYLAEHGADVNAPATNGSGYNALTGAVASGHTEIVRWLLQNGANPNYRYGPGYSPLLTAAANGHLEIVKLLLTCGADAQATSQDGKSALALARERNHPAVVDLLRDIAGTR